MSFVSTPLTQIHGKASSPYTTPTGVEIVIIGTWDRAYHVDKYTEKQIQTIDEAYGVGQSVKVTSDLFTALEIPVKVVADSVTGVSKVTERFFKQLETAIGSDVKILPVIFLSTADIGYGAELAQTGEAYLTREEWEARARVSEEALRYVSYGDDVIIEDIYSLRNSILDLIKRLRALGYDFDYLYKAEQVLKPIYLRSWDIVGARERNAITQALIYLSQATFIRSLLKRDTFSLGEVSLLRDYTKVIANLHVYVRDTGARIYMDSENVKVNWCPLEYQGQPTNWTPEKCQEFSAGWDYVYWVEDMTPLTKSDYDFEDIVLRVLLEGNILTVDVWHGEHGYTLDVYFGDTYLGTASPDSGARYNIVYVFTKKVNIETGEVVG